MRKLHIAMIVLWGVIGLLIVSVIVIGVAFQSSGFSFSFSEFSSADMTLAVDETVAAESLDQINIGLSSDECVVYLTDGDSVNVKHYVRNVPESDYVRVTSAGGNLDISTKRTGMHNIIFFGFFSSRSTVEVYIPKSYKNKLGVNISSGTLRLGSGTDNMEFSELDVRVSSGTMRSEVPIKAGSANITVTSGNIRLTGGLETDEYTLKASSGDIDIDRKLTGSGDVAVTSGTIRLGGVDIADSLSVGASSGDIRIELTGNPSLDFKGRKSSGDLRTYFDATHDGHGNYSAKVGDGPYKELDVQVTSGTIRITSAD